VCLHATASSGSGQSFGQTSGFFGKGFGGGGLLVTVSFRLAFVGGGLLLENQAQQLIFLLLPLLGGVFVYNSHLM